MGASGASRCAREELIAIARHEAYLWRGDDGDAYATIALRGVPRSVAVGGKLFRDWLQAEFAAKSATGWEGVSQSAVSEAVAFTKARTRTAPAVPEHTVATRRVWADDVLYIDIGDETERVVSVDAQGWEIRSAAPVPILRTHRTGALPTPESGGDLLDLLGRYVPTATHDDLLLVAAWFLAALRARGPYAILALSGEQGSGKSTASRVLHRLTDPSGDLLQPPRELRDLVAAAKGNAVLCFDNLSGVKPELSDAFCRLATGAELGGRALYSDDELATFVAMRPMVLNGIPDLASRGDLASRTAAVTLPRLQVRRDEAAFWKDFERDAPGLLGAALDAVVVGLANLPATPTPHHRMADFAKFACAVAPALGTDAATMTRVLDANAACQAQELIESDQLAVAIRTLVEKQGGRWRGTPREFYSAVNDEVGPLSRPRDWPQTQRAFSNKIRRISPALEHIGIQITQGHSGNRYYEIRTVP
jgi:hypothetical protein